MIPHSENDSSVFEANVLIVHFTLWSTMSGTLPLKETCLQCCFCTSHDLKKRKKKKKNEEWLMWRNPLLEELLLLYLGLIGAAVA